MPKQINQLKLTKRQLKVIGLIITLALSTQIQLKKVIVKLWSMVDKVISWFMIKDKYSQAQWILRNIRKEMKLKKSNLNRIKEKGNRRKLQNRNAGHHN